MTAEYRITVTRIEEKVRSEPKWKPGFLEYVLGLPTFTIVRDQQEGKLEEILDKRSYQHMDELTAFRLVQYYSQSGEVRDLTVSDVAEDGTVVVTRKMNRTNPRDAANLINLSGTNPTMEIVFNIGSNSIHNTDL